MKTVTLALVFSSFASTAALADACFIVEDAYTPAAYRVVYQGGHGLARSNFYATGISVAQVRHSELTAVAPGRFFSPAAMTIRDRPSHTEGGDFKAIAYQNGSAIEVETGSNLNDITILHKFVTASGDFHTHIAGNVRACHANEWTMGVINCQQQMQQGYVQQGQEFHNPAQQGYVPVQHGQGVIQR